MIHRRGCGERLQLSPRPWASCLFWVPNIMLANRVSEWGKLLGQPALGETGLGARTGTAGDTGSRTRWNRQAGERSNLPVWAVVTVTVGASPMADHHPGEQDRRGQHRRLIWFIYCAVGYKLENFRGVIKVTFLSLACMFARSNSTV